ncbi:MAG: hypothetical protein KF693_14140 [Nitrospira sp.]|nr:hypothetical protein [Nitrospira sp.]
MKLICAIVSLVGVSLSAAFAAEPRPCEWLTSSEIATVLGAAPGPAKSHHGPRSDKEIEAIAWTCDRTAGNRSASIEVIQFGSEAESTRAMRHTLQEAGGELEDIRLSPVAGPGDQALWGTWQDGAIWVVRKGHTVLSIIVAGDLTEPQSLREPMRELVQRALARL